MNGILHGMGWGFPKLNPSNAMDSMYIRVPSLARLIGWHCAYCPKPCLIATWNFKFKFPQKCDLTSFLVHWMCVNVMAGSSDSGSICSWSAGIKWDWINLRCMINDMMFTCICTQHTQHYDIIYATTRAKMQFSCCNHWKLQTSFAGNRLQNSKDLSKSQFKHSKSGMMQPAGPGLTHPNSLADHIISFLLSTYVKSSMASMVTCHPALSVLTDTWESFSMPNTVQD